jgi:hypothetical protein
MHAFPALLGGRARRAFLLLVNHNPKTEKQMKTENEMKECAAIETRTLSATDRNGTRIRATWHFPGMATQRIIRPWDHALGWEENHRAAAWDLANTHGGPVCDLLAGAGMAGGRVYLFKLSFARVS